MVKQCALICLLISASACVSIDPLDKVDVKRGNANKVLLALNDYQSKEGDMPKSLNELVPKYLDDIPSTPGIRFNRLEKSLYYDEHADWMGNTIVCSAKIGSEYWRCRK